MLTKFFSIVAGVSLAVSAFAAGGTGFTGAPAATAQVVTLTAGVPVTILTNNVTVQSVQILTAATSAVVSFYDCATTNAPYGGTNYVNTNTWYSTASYATNYATSFIGYNGVTNSYTNVGQWTYFVTNTGVTNLLVPQGAFAAVSGAITTVANPMAFQQGVSILSPSNATVIVYWTPNK